jgi:hypothetical protein
MKNVLNLSLMFAMAGIAYIITQQMIIKKEQPDFSIPDIDTYSNPEY